MLHCTHDERALDGFAPERPVTLTLRLSAADVELALTSGGASLCHFAMKALVLAQVFDLDAMEY